MDIAGMSVGLAVMSLAVAGMGAACAWLAYVVVKTKANDKDTVLVAQMLHQVIEAYVNGIETGKPKGKPRSGRMAQTNFAPTLPFGDDGETAHPGRDHAERIDGERDIEDIAEGR